MNQENFEQATWSKDGPLCDQAQSAENMVCILSIFQRNAWRISRPARVTLESETQPRLKGRRRPRPTSRPSFSNGARVMVPRTIQLGPRVVIQN